MLFVKAEHGNTALFIRLEYCNSINKNKNKSIMQLQLIQSADQYQEHRPGLTKP